MKLSKREIQRRLEKTARRTDSSESISLTEDDCEMLAEIWSIPPDQAERAASLAETVNEKLEDGGDPTEMEECKELLSIGLRPDEEELAKTRVSER